MTNKSNKIHETNMNFINHKIRTCPVKSDKVGCKVHFTGQVDDKKNSYESGAHARLRRVPSLIKILINSLTNDYKFLNR